MKEEEIGVGERSGGVGGGGIRETRQRIGRRLGISGFPTDEIKRCVLGGLSLTLS